MARQNVVQTSIGLLAIIVVLTGCGSQQASPIVTSVATSSAATSTPSPPIATFTSVQPTRTPTAVLPTATPAPLPPTPTPASATVKGKLVGKKTQKPISDDKVALCAVMQSEDKKCLFRPDLIATSGQDGSFVMTNIPAGNYVVVYALGKDVDPKSWKETTVNYGPFALDAPFDPFGGDKSSRLVDGFQFTSTLRDNKLVAVPKEGALVSIALGLTLEYVDGNPITVQVASGKTAEVEIRASGQ